VTFDEFVKFLGTEMRMSHVYQPILIRALVDAGGSATIRHLAQTLLLQDESQIQFYEDRIRKMPLPVLMKRKVVARAGDTVSLTLDRRLSFEERSEVKALCEHRLQEFVQKRGLGLWEFRMLQIDPIPGSVRYQVLKESYGRCALCGATKEVRPLDIDHIIPRSRGGTNERSNLQVLCSLCNQNKGNRDATDFTETDSEPTNVEGCPYCDKNRKFVERTGSVGAFLDSCPVTKGHTLVVPLRHTADFFSMTAQEREHADELIRVLKKRMMEDDQTITGFNICVNCGESAGQTVMHAHINLIPRRNGDTSNYRGGVRGVIPGKQNYG